MIDVRTILDAVVSHAMEQGVFERVNSHEPKSTPGYGLTAAVWVDRVEPIRAGGLDSTSVRMAVNVRLYSPMTQEPQDAIDPNMIEALDLLMEQYNGDFDLGISQVRHVDILGAHGPGLIAQAGYQSISGTPFRIYNISLPLIINDVWDQEA
jgi:hypothetical protein